MPDGAPTAVDVFWLDQAIRLGPKESLERLDTHGKYLFTLAASAGTLLTGFGLLSTTSVGAPSPLVLVPIALLAMSLAAAMMGITPRLDTVDLTDVYSIQAHYARLIRRRGQFISAAGVLFALALTSTPVVIARRAKSQPPSNPTVSAVLSETAGKAKLSLKLETDTVAPDATLHLAVTGSGPMPARAPVPLATYDGPVAGKPSLTVELDRIDEYSTFEVDYTLSTASNPIGRRSSLRLFRLPPPATPTPGTVAPPKPPTPQMPAARGACCPCATPHP